MITPFAKKVYRVVMKIPLGQLRTYKWVARKSGRPRAWRAVGNILNKNPYPFFIPCHRVVRSNSDFGNYVFGKKAKKDIIDLEKQILSAFAQKTIGVSPWMNANNQRYGGYRRIVSKADPPKP